MRWGWHVALAVKISNSNPDIRNTLWILDPALSKKPMTKAEFHQMFSSHPSFISGFVTCDANTVNKDDMCVQATDNRLQFLQISRFLADRSHDYLDV